MLEVRKSRRAFTKKQAGFSLKAGGLFAKSRRAFLPSIKV